MHIFKELLRALWIQDFKILSNPSLVWTIYFLVFVVLFLENSLLPAAFLPGDSLLILLGVLIAKNVLSFPLVLFLLTIAASVGSWIGYIQGRWLKNNRVVKSWLAYLPTCYHKRAHLMFHRYGLSALLIGRFIAFVRTLLPTIAGLSGLRNSRFHFFNWISSFLWVFILTLMGFALGKTSIFKLYEKKFILCLILLPLTLLSIGLVGSIIIIWRRQQSNNSNKK